MYNDKKDRPSRLALSTDEVGGKELLDNSYSFFFCDAPDVQTITIAIRDEAEG